MFTAKVTNSRGDSLTLFPSNLYYCEITDGLTPPRATLNYSVVGTNDGSIFNSARLENRNLVLQITPLQDIERSRINLYRFFRVKQLCTFYFKNGSRDVYIEGYVESVDGDLFSNKQTIQISIMCTKPYFKAIEETVTDVSQIMPLFSFPFAISAAGIEFSEILKRPERNVYNDGDSETGVIIELRAIGAVSNPRIYEEAGGGIGINIDMLEGDIITINTNVGEKAVTLFRDGVETNIINKVQPNPTWFKLQPGDNVFSYAADGLDLLQIVFKHYSQFEGV